MMLLCFISESFFCQTYHFDYKCYDVETQSKGNYKGNKRTNIIYFSSENKNIIAYNYFFSQQPNRSFRIYDYHSNLAFSYSINRDSNFSSLNFNQKSQINKYPDELIIKRIDVQNIGENQFIIKTYSSLKNKRSNLELKVTVMKSDYPMPVIHFLDLSPNIHSKIYDALLANLDSENYRLMEVVSNHKNGVVMLDDFSKCEKINLKILTHDKAESQDK